MSRAPGAKSEKTALLASCRRQLSVAFVVVFGSLSCGGDAAGPGITLVVTPNPVQLFVGDSVQLSVSALDGSGHLVTGVAVTFTAADPTLITVSNVGMVRPQGRTGTSSVRVAGGGAVTDVPVTVSNVPAGILIAPADTAVRTTATAQFRAAVIDAAGDTIFGLPITWQSTDTAVARVTANGLAIARSASGSAFIVARYGPFGAAGRLRVVAPGVPVSIAVNPADTTISSGADVQLTATVRDGFGDPVPSAPVEWVSGADAIATVSITGLVHSEGPSGTVLIHARSGSLQATARVVVLDSLLDGRVSLGNQPFAADISAPGVLYVGQGTAGRLARADLPARTFTTSVTVGSVPTDLVFNSTGTRAYVTNQFSQNVGVVDVATNTQVDVIPVTGDPFAVLVAPGDSIIYVTTNANHVYGIRLATKAIVAAIALPATANGLAARDTLLYVSTRAGGTVVEVNLRTRTVARTFTVGGMPQKMGFSSDGTELYIANEAGYVQFWDLVAGSQIGSNLVLPQTGAYGLARRPSNGLLYVSNAYFGTGNIFVIDPVARSLVYTAVLGGSTRTVVFNQSGSIGVVTNESGWVDFIK